MQYTINDIAKILGAQSIFADKNALIQYLSIDSRKIAFPRTSLFFALQTPRRDGHSFIAELYAQGVHNFVVHESFEVSGFGDANFILVKDTLAALQRVSSSHRSRFDYPVIGITGSNGKTIVKEWLYQLLSSEKNIVRSPRSYNSQVGVPLSIWQMNNQNELAIFEAGISMPGEMEKLQKIIKPTIGIITNIGDAHGENFSDKKEKLAEKLVLFKKAGLIFFPADDELIAAEINQRFAGAQLVSWGNSKNATVRVTELKKNTADSSLHIVYNNKEYHFSIPFTDDASVQNALCCASVLLHLGYEGILKTTISKLQPVDMRLQMLHGINNNIVINDSYNFDISSLPIMLSFLAQQTASELKTIIVSDLPGDAASEQYIQVIYSLKNSSIQRLVAIGEHWKKFQATADAAIQKTEYYSSTDSFLKNFQPTHFRNEAILLKGARHFEFEKIVAVLEKKVHQTVMEINLNALIHNLNTYRSRLRKDVKLMAMVKAFAYGSGSAEIAATLQFHKTDYLAVAYADEGVELRKAGIRLPIMVMNVDEAAFETIIEHNLEPEIFSQQLFSLFSNFLQRQGIMQYPVHLKIDTGMHRLGFEKREVPALCEQLKNNRQVIVQSVFSHLSSSEDASDDAFTMQQANVFDDCCLLLKQALGYDFIQHISNSAAIFRKPQLQYNMVRVGIGLYGIDSSATMQDSLQTVATLKTTIAQIKHLQPGEFVGYNRKGKIEKPSVIATIRIGYADGFRRSMGNGIGHVYIKNKLAPVIGNVAMDMCMVDITSINGVKENDEVEIFGAHLPVQQVAAWCNTIPYEILTSISQRVKRIYSEE